MSKRQIVDPRAYARKHAQLAAEVRATDARARAWSSRAADIALGATFTGLLVAAANLLGG